MILRDKVMQQIGKLLDGKCDGCTQLKELNRIHGHSTSHIDGYCQRTCEVGLQLKSLGKQLNSALSPRVVLAFDDEEIAQNVR